MRIIELLGAMLLVASVLGWWRHHERIARLESQDEFSLPKPSYWYSKDAEPEPVLMLSNRDYCGPRWLQRLVTTGGYRSDDGWRWRLDWC